MSERFSQLRMVAEAAKDAGYSQEERRRLIEHPQELVSDQVSPKFAEKISPTLIDAILLKLHGRQGPDSPLIDLGNTLYDFEKRLSADSDTLTQEETKFLGVAAQLFQRALYDGSLSELHGANGAATAFLVNRLTKLEQMKPRGNESTAVDVQSFEMLTESVSRFFDKHYSEQAIDQAIHHAKEKADRSKDNLDHSSDPDVQSYLEQKRVSADLTQEAIDLEQRAPELLREFANRLEEAGDLFVTIYGNAGPKDKEALRDLRSVIQTMRSLEEAQAKSWMRSPQDEYEVRNPNFSTSLLGKVARDDEKREQLWHSLFHLSFNLQKHIERSEKKLAEIPERVSTKGGSLAEQVAVLQRDTKMKELDQMKTLVSVFDELSTHKIDGPGIWARKYSVTRMNTEAQRQMRLAKQTLRGKEDPEFARLIDRLEGAEMEQAFLSKQKTQLETYRRWFEKSLEWLRADVKRSSTEMMYFIKTVLVAADIRREASTKHPEMVILGLPKPIEDSIATHEFVEYDHETRFGPNRWYGEDYQPPKKFKYSDVHFKTDHLPFALIMTDYFRSKKQPRVSV